MRRLLPLALLFALPLWAEYCKTTTTTPPDGIVGHPYSYVLKSQGGASPYAYFESGGSLPDGLVIQGKGDDGWLRGTPRKAGTFTFTLTAFEYGGASCTPVRVTITIKEQQ